MRHQSLYIFRQKTKLFFQINFLTAHLFRTLIFLQHVAEYLLPIRKNLFKGFYFEHCNFEQIFQGCSYIRGTHAVPHMIRIANTKYPNTNKHIAKLKIFIY